MFGVNEALWGVECVSSVGRSNSDRSARAKLWLFEETLRIPAPLLAQKAVVLTAKKIPAVEGSKAQECGLPLTITEVPDRGDALVVGHKERMTTVNSGPSQTALRPYVNAAFSVDADALSAYNLKPAFSAFTNPA